MDRQEELELADQLAKAIGERNAYAYKAVMRMRTRLAQTPMSEILDPLLKTEKISQVAARLGVSRQAIYSWMNGRTRPTKKAARRLAKLTGVAEAEIRGK